MLTLQSGSDLLEPSPLERQVIAYLILFVLAAAIAARVAYSRYNRRERRDDRRRARENEAHRKLMDERPEP